MKSKALPFALLFGAALPSLAYAQTIGVPAISPTGTTGLLPGVQSSELDGGMGYGGMGYGGGYGGYGGDMSSRYGSDPTRTNSMMRNQQLPHENDPKANPASGVPFQINPPPVIDPINRAAVPLTNKEQAGSTISQHWRAARSMPSTGKDGAVVFTYGATQPSLVCAPLTVCLLKLEPGERILKNGLQAGDTARWHITPSIMGSGQTVLVIKPTDAALRTTMAIMTNKRVYSVNLVSVAAQSRAMSIAEFSYPEEEQAAWQDYYRQQEETRQNGTMENGRNVSQLDFGYKITGDNPAWRPKRAYNDGVHTYIQFPDAMRSSDSPSLLTLARDGSWFSNPTGQLVNYRKEGNTYVVDLVIDRAELVLGVGGPQKRVVITHKGKAN